MTKQAFDEAVREAAEFIKRAKAVQWNRCDGDNPYWHHVGSVESAALKRQSMELTRALSRMRKP